jgi:predicted RNase H-like nuclease (RuvC/YqgF family)
MFISKEKLENLKKVFFNEETPAPVSDSKFLDAELKDGTKIKIEGEVIEIGKKVTVVTEEGEIEAPNGTHELADGSKLVIEAGLITEVIPAEKKEEKPAEPVENSEDEFKKQTAKSILDLQNSLNELKDKLNAVRKENRELESKMAEAVKKDEKFKAELFPLIESVLEVPAVKPTQAPSKFSTVKPNQLDVVAKAIQNLKSQN